MSELAHLYRCTIVLIWRAVVAAFVLSCAGAAVHVAFNDPAPDHSMGGLLLTWLAIIAGVWAGFAIATFPGIWARWPERS